MAGSPCELDLEESAINRLVPLPMAELNHLGGLKSAAHLCSLAPLSCKVPYRCVATTTYVSECELVIKVMQERTTAADSDFVMLQPEACSSLGPCDSRIWEIHDSTGLASIPLICFTSELHKKFRI